MKIEIEHRAGEGLVALLRNDPQGEPLCSLPFRRSPYCNLDDMLSRVLRDASLGKVELDATGKVSEAQQRHWLRHLIVPSQTTCGICAEEYESERRRERRAEATRYASGVVSPGGKVIVRRIGADKASKAKGSKRSERARVIGFAAEDLGF